MTERNFNTSGFLASIRSRLLASFAAVAIILLIAVFLTQLLVDSGEASARKVVEIDLPIYDRLDEIDSNLYLAQSSLRAWLLTGDQTFKQEFDIAWANIERAQPLMDNLAKHWDAIAINKWNELKAQLSQLKSNQINLLNTLPGEKLTDQQRSLLFLTNGLENKILDLIEGVITPNGERFGGLYTTQFNSIVDETHKILNDLFNIHIVEYLLMLIIIIVSAFIALFTARKIVNPLKNAISIAKSIAAGERHNNIKINSKGETGELLQALNAMQNAIREKEEELHKNEERTRLLFENIVRTAKTFSNHSSKVAAGDLRERLEVPSENAMSQLGEDLNTMTESLASITNQISEASHHMVSTLEEVKAAIDVQSSGATEQASSINEITSSIEEIEKSTTQTMEKAKVLGAIAERTREKGKLGLDAVEQSIEGMQIVRDKVQTIAQTILDLSNQTQQIGEITNIVNSLAQQSKMLALNASIEAAKAGEAGKGFAVVAVEVKNLAEQSEQSTVQVQKILEDIKHITEKAVMVTEEGTKGVDRGTGLVEQTGEIVRSLSEVIGETEIASQQIEAAIGQESVGIEQITAGMNEINQVTSSFVASAQQTIVAMNNLAQIASNLKTFVDVYKT